MKDTNRGSLTIEAAIVVPIFMFAIMSIILMIKMVLAYQLVQHSISESARVLGDYSYILQVTGVKDKHDDIMGELAARKQEAENAANAMTDFKDSMNNLQGSLSKLGGTGGWSGSLGDGIAKIGGYVDTFKELDGSAKNVVSSGENIVNQVQMIKNDPKGFLMNIVSYFAYEKAEEAKGKLLGFYTQGMTRWIFLDGNSFDQLLKNAGVENGIADLQFDKSRLFKDGSDDIDIIVHYKVKLNLPVPVMKEVNMVQRATVKAWMDGE